MTKIYNGTVKGGQTDPLPPNLNLIQMHNSSSMPKCIVNVEEYNSKRKVLKSTTKTHQP